MMGNLKANIIVNSLTPVEIKLKNVLFSKTPLTDAVVGASKYSGSDLFKWKFNSKDPYFSVKGYSTDEQLAQSIDRNKEKTKNQEIFWTIFEK
jgi:hypothetical protein